jgi:hypothetical protein
MRYGSFPIVYTLTPKGWREIGQTPPRFKRTEQSAPHLLHSLAVNDVCIAAELLTRRHDQVFVETEHEWEFKRQPYRTDEGSVAPDALLRFQVGNEPQDIIWEIDQGTETQKQWLNKLTKLLAFVQGPFQERYVTAYAPTIAILTTTGEKRREHLREWTAELDTEALCLFSSVDRRSDPDILFLSPVWYPSQDGAAESLLALP